MAKDNWYWLDEVNKIPRFPEKPKRWKRLMLPLGAFAGWLLIPSQIPNKDMALVVALLLMFVAAAFLPWALFGGRETK